MVLPKERVKKYKDKIRHLSRRQQGKSLIEVIRKLNEVIRGFSNYFRVGNVRVKFKGMDKWIRMRERSYIRGKRSMESNWRIPNKVLDQAVLVSMVNLLTDRSSFASEIEKGKALTRKWGTDGVKAVCGKSARTV